MRSEAGCLPRDVDAAVRALCSDYFRRSEVIKARSASYRVIMEYRYLNYRIYTAACEAVGEDDALKFIEEIGCGVGYAKSEIDTVSERVYKSRKLLVKQKIAEKLALFQ